MNKNIPEDVLLMILCRLPVKSLLRFRCVSKSWQSMIDDPDFCHLHLKCFENNTHQTHLLFLQHEDLVVRRSDTMETTETIGFEAAYAFLEQKSNLDECCTWEMECLMDGLVLLLEVESSKLLLWNPSIRKIHILPPLPETCDRMESGCFGLGFDPLTKDLKHVRLAKPWGNVLPSVLVYSFQARSWKVVQFQGKGFSGQQWRFCRYLATLGSQTVSYRGYICFISRNQDLDRIALFSFDLSSEVFASIPLPHDEEDEWDMGHELRLAVIDGELLLAKYYEETTSGSVWVLESSGTEAGFESMCWKRRCSFCTGVPELHSMSVLKKGDLLIRSFSKVVRYNVETDEVKVLLNLGDANILINIYDYVESLMLLR